MLCFPNCKINLGLYVTRKRDDGYHDLETVFYPVKLRDVLEIVPAATTQLHVSGLSVSGNNEDNLVWKAYQLLQRDYPFKVPAIDVYLHKVIPMGAGLGGGSADGAYMLRLLNDCFALGISDSQLADYAIRLGSDCPFFIYNTPRFATGRGEQMSPLSLDLSAYSLQLICPEVHVSTAQAFRMLTPRPAPFDLRNIVNLPIEQWRDRIGNDFEAPVFQQHPELAGIKDQLYRQCALYAAMSGSGSSIFGIFPKNHRADISAAIPFKTFYAE
jgi:4-diphosphocytidyl-2-C-methyl-D-erythritol kinase